MGDLFVYFLFFLPVILTIWNLATFVFYLVKKRERKWNKFIEITAMCIGATYLAIYMSIRDMTFEAWNAQLENNQTHSLLSPEHATTIFCLLILSFIGYFLLRFIPAHMQSPIVTTAGISIIYLGMICFVVFCIQVAEDWLLMIVPINIILIFIKTVFYIVYEKNKLIQAKQVSLKYKKLEEILNNATNLPLVALVFVIPLLGILIIILFLFGQEPNSVIKAWTETADWTLSQRVGPPNVMFDEHYLCTVAAGGHEKIVKPQRTGTRHGHVVLVNRQLCIANAFEQILEEQMPKTHSVIRGVYDRTGYPVAKHIRSKTVADLIYFLMKPLEWLFLFIIYTVDVHPEDRIAVQYPHSEGWRTSAS